MRTNVLVVAFGVAALCGFMFYSQYLRFHGQFVGGRYVDPETGRAFAERGGLMWGSLFVIALLLGFVASRRR